MVNNNMERSKLNVLYKVTFHDNRVGGNGGRERM